MDTPDTSLGETKTRLVFLSGPRLHGSVGLEGTRRAVLRCHYSAPLPCAGVRVPGRLQLGLALLRCVLGCEEANCLSRSSLRLASVAGVRSGSDGARQLPDVFVALCWTRASPLLMMSPATNPGTPPPEDFCNAVNLRRSPTQESLLRQRMAQEEQEMTVPNVIRQRGRFHLRELLFERLRMNCHTSTQLFPKNTEFRKVH